MSTVSVTGSGGFAFDLPGIEESIAEWEKLATDLHRDDVDLGVLGDVRGPGDEFSSDDLARQANESIRSFTGHLADMRTFVDNYLVKLRQARDDYLAKDGGAARTFGR